MKNKGWKGLFQRDKKIVSNIKGFNPYKTSSLGLKLIIYYLVAILVGSGFLMIPEISLVEGHSLDYDDGIFIATSAFSDTGLSPVNISEKFTIFGQVLIMLFIQLGGIGIVAFKYIIWWVIFDNSKLSQNEENILHLEKGGTQKAKSSTIIRRALIMFFTIELLGFLVFAIYFLVQDNISIGNEIGDNISPIDNEGQAIFYGLFHSISSMNNAGFDIFGGRSLQAFDHDQFIQTFTLILFIIGGIGFPILYDMLFALKSRFIDNKKVKMMLLTKIVLACYFSVMIVGVSLSALSEAVVASKVDYIYEDEIIQVKPLFSRDDYSDYEKWMNVMFHTSSARSAGFAFYPMEYFSPSTRALVGILMFIGAGPSSTGGGIRVSTFFIIILALFSYRRNKGQINIWRRTIDRRNKGSAFRTLISSGIAVIAIAVVLTLVMGLRTGANESSQEQLFFETVSAFGTTGLSYKGLTASLTTVPKLLLCLMMIIGQVGMNNVLTMFKKEGRANRRSIRKYPIEYIVGI